MSLRVAKRTVSIRVFPSVYFLAHAVIGAYTHNAQGPGLMKLTRIDP